MSTIQVFILCVTIATGAADISLGVTIYRLIFGDKSFVEYPTSWKVRLIVWTSILLVASIIVGLNLYREYIKYKSYQAADTASRCELYIASQCGSSCQRNQTLRSDMIADCILESK
jgi:hypothetical protein